MNSPHNVPQYPTRRKTVKKNNSKLVILLVTFFVVIAIVLFLNSSISKITDIKIIGLELLTEDEVYEKSEIYSDMYYFFVDTASIQNKLKDVDLIKEVKVSKEFPGMLTIEIQEKQFVAYLNKSDQKWIPVLEDGTFFSREYKEGFMNLPLITEWKNTSLISDLVSELILTKESVLEQISEITQNPQKNEPKRVLIYMRDGYRIHALVDDLSQKLNLYPEILEGISSKTSKKGDIYLIDSIRFIEFENIQN